MAPIDWADQHSVGVKKFDDDHRELIALFNELEDAVRVGKGRAALRLALLGMSSYSQQHFAAEEAAMERTYYCGYETHIAEHREFTAKLMEFMRAHEIGDTGVGFDVLEYMQQWLEHHIRVTDARYGEHMNANGVQ